MAAGGFKPEVIADPLSLFFPLFPLIVESPAPRHAASHMRGDVSGPRAFAAATSPRQTSALRADGYRFAKRNGESIVATFEKSAKYGHFLHR